MRRDGKLLAQLRTEGFCVMADALDPSVAGGLDADLAERFAATPFCEGGFYGTRTKRFGGLLKRSAAAEHLVLHERVLGLAEAVLGPHCDRFQLNLTQALELHPGQGAQPPHRDEDMWGGDKGGLEYLLNVMWPLTPFTAENGATLVYRGSQNGGGGREAPGRPEAIEMRPGAALLFLGSTLHGGGANRSTEVRRGVIVSYCLGWLKPFENQWLVYPPAVARTFSPELAAMVGYRQHRPNLGNYEGRCPSVLLREDAPDALGAVDELRPEQAGAVAAWLAAQRTA
jgi:ectoine hydroxylase-related dioxygenase (phytanoyl-CoA dioxygenase family)